MFDMDLNFFSHFCLALVRFANNFDRCFPVYSKARHYYPTGEIANGGNRTLNEVNAAVESSRLVRQIGGHGVHQRQEGHQQRNGTESHMAQNRLIPQNPIKHIHLPPVFSHHQKAQAYESLKSHVSTSSQHR